MRQSKQIAINTLSSWIGMFANAAVLIFLTKFLLNRLGSEQYGMLRYVITIQGSLVFLDLGLGATLNRFVSRLLAAKDVDRLNAAVSFTSLLFLGLGLLSGLVMAGMGFILPSLVRGATAELYSSGLLLMIFMGGALAVRFWGYAARGVLFGMQKHFVVNIITTVAALLRALSITVLFVTMESAGLVTVGLCFLGCAILQIVAMWMFTKLQLPQMKLGLKVIEKPVAKEIIGFSVWVLLMGATTMLIANMPTFFAGRLYGPEAVAFISLPLLILNQIQRISGGFAFSLIPVAGRYGSLEDKRALQKILTRGTKFCAMVCFPIGVIAVIFSQPLFEWFKEGFGWTWVLLTIMVLPLLLRTCQRVAFSVLMGAGSIKWLALGQIVLVLAIGLLSWLLAVYFNMKLYGIALGWGVPVFLYSATFASVYACRQIGIKWASYMFQSYGRVVIGTLPTAVVAGLLLQYAYPGSLSMLIFDGLICMMVFVATAYYFILTVDERRSILGILKREVSYDEQIIETSDI